MHSIKEIRKNFQTFKETLKKRFINLDIDKIILLDENNRKYIQEKEILEKRKKIISKSKDKSLFEESKNISIKIEKLINLQLNTNSELEKILSNIPNIPNEDVPIGEDENSNIEISKSGDH